MKPVYIYKVSSIHTGNTPGDSPYLSACEPDYKELIPNPTLRRRMSRIVKMGVSCGLECIDGVDTDEIGAIITATGLGCLADTEKFMNSLIDNQEKLLNPTPFIQSTFNTIGGQIALLRKIHAYNVTYVHRGFSFESALIDAMLRIAEGNKYVLVGAVDEITDTSYQIHQRLGLLRNIKMGEGAQFFLLGNKASVDAYAELVDIDTFSAQRQPMEQWTADRVIKFLHRNELSPTAIDHFVSGENGNENQDRIYAGLEEALFSHAQSYTFKDQCGEYPTASSFALWKACRLLKNTSAESEQYILIYNHYNRNNHSLMLLRKRL